MNLSQESQISLELKQIGVKQLLQEKILILLRELNFENLKITDIPLYRLKNENQIIYRTSILKKIPELNQKIKTDSFKIFEPIKVKIKITGEIDLEISDRSLSFWLQKLLEISRTWEKKSKEELNQFTADIFTIQYAHARCCALLRLGEEERIIRLKQGEFTLVEPLKISWLLLKESTEKKLINQLIAMVDALNNSEDPNWIAQGNNLSIAMLEFYSSCRIWGEVIQKNSQLSQARLGLISLVQTLLFCLIQEQLRVSAITEL